MVVYDPEDGTVRYASGKPDWASLLEHWPSDRKTYIAQLEVLAAIAVYFTYPELFAGRSVNHFIECAASRWDPPRGTPPRWSVVGPPPVKRSKGTG